MALALVALSVIICFMHFGYGLMELQSMQMVACTNKHICQDGKNLRIVLQLSTIETTEGTGSISGIITGGQSWTDSHGNWSLIESMSINIDYQNAIWEYQLQGEEEFSTKGEQLCGAPFMPAGNCDATISVSCPNYNGYGLSYFDVESCTKYTIDNVESWQASVSIQSSHLNISWAASNLQHSIWETNAEVYLASAFDTTSCYQDLSNQYYVVVPDDGKYYFTSTQYWQDARNNFNLSLATWKRDFDCNYQWDGWHTIIPFYEDEEAYAAMAEVGDSGANPRIAWAADQLYAWKSGYVDRFYAEVMNALTGECTDETTYADAVLGNQGPPADMTYKVAKLGIVDYFEMVLDLDHTQFVQMPTPDPTEVPTMTPTVQPTSTPSNAPITTQPPSDQPTQFPTDSITDTFALLEIPAKLEITSSSHINISSQVVQEDIIESIASGLNYGREYIRLDTADFMTSISGRRRLQSNTESLLLEFTMFTTNAEDKSLYITKLEETSTYHFILAAISNKISHVLSIFIANIIDTCPAGSQSITVAGQRRCQSVCSVNQYYDTASSSCKDQVEFIITTNIKKNILGRVIHFGIGMAGWAATLGLAYMAYKYYVNRKLSSQIKKSSKGKKKKSIQQPVYSVGSEADEDTDTDLTQEPSDYAESEFDQITSKFASMTGNIKSSIVKAKDKLSGKDRNMDEDKKNRKSLLDNDESSESESSSGSEYSGETESGDTGSESTGSESESTD